MKIAVLQFAPRLGDIEQNFIRADAILARSGLEDETFAHGDTCNTFSYGRVSGEEDNDDLERIRTNPKADLLVLPEMAFSGYNFSCRKDIEPFLEPTAAGPTAQWAARTARRLRCLVCVGYPETTSDPEVIPKYVGSCLEGSLPQETSASALHDHPRTNFNSLLVVGPDGAIHAHYRKSHLYYTDATWASPSPSGFSVATLPLPNPFPSTSYELMGASNTISQKPLGTAVDTSFAICMDLNPQYFTAPWTAYEAATHTRQARASLMLVSCAWLTRIDPFPAEEPDWDTIAYWLERLTPLMETEGIKTNPALNIDNVLVVIANRTGTEPGECRACELDPVLRDATTSAPCNLHDSMPASDEVLKTEDNIAKVASQSSTEPVGILPLRRDSCSYPDEEQKSDLGARPVIMEQAVYAGSSSILGLGGAKAQVWAVLGRGEEDVLFVDTASLPIGTWTLKRRNESVED